MNIPASLNPTEYRQTFPSGEKRWYMTKAGKMAVVKGWSRDGKWKVLDVLQTYRSFRDTKEFVSKTYDTLEEALEVYSTLFE